MKRSRVGFIRRVIFDGKPQIRAVHLHGGHKPRLTVGSFRPDKTANPRRTRRDFRFAGICDFYFNRFPGFLCFGNVIQILLSRRSNFKGVSFLPSTSAADSHRKRIIQIKHEFVQRFHDQRFHRQNAFDRLFGNIRCNRQIVMFDIIRRLLRHQNAARFRRTHTQIPLRENRK